MLQRTQLMLDEQLKQDLLFLSEEKSQSISQLVRQWLGERIAVEKKKIKRRKKRVMSGAEALLAMAKEAERIEKKYGSSGPTDLSYNLDHYLYGAPKKPLPKNLKP